MAAGPLRIADAHTHLFKDAEMADLWLGPKARRTGLLDELTSLLERGRHREGRYPALPPFR